jgi:hypothetical protein
VVSTTFFAGKTQRLAVAVGLARALAGKRDVDAVIGEDVLQQRDVGEARHVFEHQRLVGEQARDHQGSVAFLAPEIGIVPLSGLPPRMRMRSKSGSCGGNGGWRMEAAH